MSIQIAKQLEVGDIFYECEYGVGITLETTTKPIRTEDGQWKWTAEIVDTSCNKSFEVGTAVDYMITEGFAHYGPKITLDSWG